MRTLLGSATALAATIIVTSGLAAPPAQAGVNVRVEQRGACYYVYVGDKQINRNGLCYLGPPPIELPIDGS